MPTCPECNAENDERAFCANCGTYLYQPSYHRAKETVAKRTHIGSR